MLMKHSFHGKKNEDNWHICLLGLSAVKMMEFPSDDLFILGKYEGSQQLKVVGWVRNGRLEKYGKVMM